MNKIITGDTAGFTFSILYAGAVDGREAPDLSGADVVFAIKKHLTDPDSKTIVKKIVAKPETNIVHFEVTAEETGKLSVGTYEGCCKIYYDSGLEKTVWQDTITVTKGVLGAGK